MKNKDYKELQKIKQSMRFWDYHASNL